MKGEKINHIDKSIKAKKLEIEKLERERDQAKYEEAMMKIKDNQLDTLIQDFEYRLYNKIIEPSESNAHVYVHFMMNYYNLLPKVEFGRAFFDQYKVCLKYLKEIPKWMLFTSFNVFRPDRHPSFSEMDKDLDESVKKHGFENRWKFFYRLDENHFYNELGPLYPYHSHEHYYDITSKPQNELLKLDVMFRISKGDKSDLRYKLSYVQHSPLNNI